MNYNFEMERVSYYNLAPTNERTIDDLEFHLKYVRNWLKFVLDL